MPANFSGVPTDGGNDVSDVEGNVLRYSDMHWQVYAEICATL